jgi:membrane dipeptidase
MSKSTMTRRDTLRTFGAGAIAAIGTSLSPSAAVAGTASADESESSGTMPRRRRSRILMDGHVHVTNKIFWLGVDPWKPSPTGTGWDYARAAAAGVNVIIENPSPYGYWSYDMTPKHILRLFETFHRFAEANEDKMAVALTVEHAREIVESGRMAVFLSCESGWDHEGDLDVLRALYRLGLRAVQFSSQSGFNAFSDVQPGLPSGGAHWGGINDRGRALVEEMNALGVLIDITHASTAAQSQIVAASKAPVIASHVTAAAVSGAGGLSDDLIKALAAKGGVMGIHGGSGSVGVRYKQWVAQNPQRAAKLSAAINAMVQYRPSFPRSPDESNYGDFIARVDQESRERTQTVFVPYVDPPDAAAVVPTPDEWAQQVDHVLNLVGPAHVGIGLDMFGGRSSVPQDASGYPLLVDAIGRVTTPRNVELVTGENWLRVLEQVQGVRDRDGREKDRDERLRHGSRQNPRGDTIPVPPRETHAAATTSLHSCCC